MHLIIRMSLPASVNVAGTVVSIQACAVAAAGAVASLLVFVAASGLSWPARAATFITMLLVSLVTAYNINCAVYGQCRAWAWVLVALFAFNLVTAASIGALESTLRTSSPIRRLSSNGSSKR